MVIKKREEEIVLLGLTMRESRGHTYWINNKNVLIGEVGSDLQTDFRFLRSSWISWYHKRMPN